MNREQKIEVWFDGDCPLCQRSRSWCELRDHNHLLRFHDFRTSDDEQLPVPRDLLATTMWVRDPSGRMERGFSAWRRILAELPGWRWLALISGVPPMRWLGPSIYALVARWRRQEPLGD